MKNETQQDRSHRGSVVLKVVVLVFAILTAAWFLYRRLVIADTFPGL